MGDEDFECSSYPVEFGTTQALVENAVTKLFYLALRNISQKWTMPIRDWKAALTRFTIQFGDRISVN